jgi:hypothetical protein
MGVLEAAALEVGHRVGLAPDDIVEDPEVQILQRGADAEDIVIGADDPERAGRLQDAAAGQQPGTRKGIIGFEGGKLIPLVIDSIDQRLVGAVQRAAKLEVIGRIGEDDVYGVGRQGFKRSNAIALDDRVDPGTRLCGGLEIGKRKY